MLQDSGWVDKYWGERKRAEEEITEALHKNDIFKKTPVRLLAGK